MFPPFSSPESELSASPASDGESTAVCSPEVELSPDSEPVSKLRFSAVEARAR